jgi:hypothetical protein
MTNVPDQDLMLLESYLDDELSADEVDALRDRLIEEPQLAAALAQLRDARTGRQRVFAAIEPGELEVSDCVGRMQRAVHGRLRWSRRTREGLRYVAAAACVTIGVMIGSKATQPAAPSANPFGGGLVASNAPGLGQLYNPVFTDPGPAMPVQFNQSLQPVLPAATPRVVVLHDGRNIVAAYEFKTTAEAHQFVAELRGAAAVGGHAIVPAPRSDVAPRSGSTFVSTPAVPAGNNQVIPVAASEQY